ncbi:MAG: hypothetical protein OEY81_07045 [Candidatus Bathyarchaeota archaeon]|nr:hypothetical protein [Candidatus Bathyarchaeota archaeon]
MSEEFIVKHSRVGAPTEKDIRMAHETANRLSSVIQMSFDVNMKIPPMPPYPAIPKKNLQELIEHSEGLVHQVIVFAKQLVRHGQTKELEVGPLVAGLAAVDVPDEVRIHFPGEMKPYNAQPKQLRRKPKVE